MKDDQHDIASWQHPAYAAAQRGFEQAEQRRARDLAGLAALREARAASELAALGCNPLLPQEPPVQRGALYAAIAAHFQDAAPAPAHAITRAQAPSQAPINALGGRETVLTRAARAGVRRLPSFNGHKCQTAGCTYNAAWQTGDGRYLCNPCAEKVVR